MVRSIPGRWTLECYRPDWLRFAAAPLAVGIAVYVVVRALPLNGGFIFLGTALLGLSAVTIWVRGLLSGEASER